MLKISNKYSNNQYGVYLKSLVSKIRRKINAKVTKTPLLGVLIIEPKLYEDKEASSLRHIIKMIIKIMQELHLISFRTIRVFYPKYS